MLFTATKEAGHSNIVFGESLIRSDTSLKEREARFPGLEADGRELTNQRTAMGEDRVLAHRIVSFMVSDTRRNGKRSEIRP
jgi:hypothetical protein